MKKIIYALSLQLLFGSFTAYACDLCSLYYSIESEKPVAGRITLGVAEQFTEYNKVQTEGVKVSDPMNQRLASSVTQVVGTYDLTDRISFQLNLPYTSRQYRQLHDGMLHDGVEAGIGDLTLTAKYLALQYHENDQYLGMQLIGGIKLPTGSSARLKDESVTMPEDPAMEDPVMEDNPSMDHHMHMLPRHGDEDHTGHVSAVHGHDLALGSGSVDFPVGVSVFLETGKLFLKGSAIYTIRTEGDYDYQYANDTMWNVGPGYYLLMEEHNRVAARVALSGERKGKDTGAGGLLQADTGTDTIFLGPELSFTLCDQWSGDIGVDFPLSIDNSGTQAVAAYKLKAGLTYQF